MQRWRAAVSLIIIVFLENLYWGRLTGKKIVHAYNVDLVINPSNSRGRFVNKTWVEFLYFFITEYDNKLYMNTNFMCTSENSPQPVDFQLARFIIWRMLIIWQGWHMMENNNI